MLIPLLSVILFQLLIKKMKISHTFAIFKPTNTLILIAIFLPILLALGLQQFFHSIYQEHFLFIEYKELLPLIMIGVTISSLSALLEEIIWRGNYHYYLRQNYNLLKTANIQGVIWSIWHLPIALFYKPYTNLLIAIPNYLILMFTLSCVLTIVREKGKSIIPVAIFHGMFNVFYLSDGIQMTLSVELQEIIKCILLLLIVVFIFSKQSIIKKSG
ncbi:CPBP family glutamic-type intramembrane protease [Viridibacillus sp. NPDC096237]|uniref:CPBP family glutamic-type intramembrane protease n=1 Tax=Viridibacillus sp. NPDC096237 TaxID=3390721 RepID=UPI003D086EFC